MSYLQITLQVEQENRESASAVYNKYREIFLTSVDGAIDKQLLVRDEDVQVIHTFRNHEVAQTYLESTMFTQDIVSELGPLLTADPDIRIYNAV